MKITSENKQLCLDESQDRVLVRSQKRQTELGEVFTPTELTLEILEQMPKSIWEEGKTFLDPTCGNGQLLAPVAIIKRELGHTNWLETIYGVDLMKDNVDETRERLLAIAGDTEENRKIVENNIRCENGLKYDYSFGGPGSFESFFDPD